MKINWKVRFKNRFWVLAFCTAILSFVYQLLSFFEIVPKVPQEDLLKFISIIIEVLTTLGIIVDPTTPGTQDSNRAMQYNVPGGIENE